MQVIDGRPVFSATDLVGFLACEHLTALELAAAAGLVTRPMRADPELDLIAQRGLDHERRYLKDLEAQGRRVTRIATGDDADAPAPPQTRGDHLRKQAADTQAAMR